MKEYLICFDVTGGLTVEAESYEEALEYVRSESGQEAIGIILAQNDVTVTEISELGEET